MDSVKYLFQARQLHIKTPVVDSHNDLAGEILYRHNNGERNVIKRLYLHHWRAAHFKLIVSSIYIENSAFFPNHISSEEKKEYLNVPIADWQYYFHHDLLDWDSGWKEALSQIHHITQEIQEASGDLMLVTTKNDLDELLQNDKIGILLYMEGLDCIGNHLDRLNKLYQLGVRGASLTWSRQNLIATGCCTAARHIDIPGELTDFGLQVIQRMKELSMFLDISHLNNEGFSQILSVWQSPLIATHSNAYSVYPNYRNLTDLQMKQLASQGGILGLNACRYIVGNQALTEPDSSSSETRPYDSHISTYRDTVLDAMCEHIEYIVKTIGAKHVGYGFDLCDSYSLAKLTYESRIHHLPAPIRAGSPSVSDSECLKSIEDFEGIKCFEPEDCLQNHEEALFLTARLLARGMEKEKVLLIIGLNWWNYFRTYLPE